MNHLYKLRELLDHFGEKRIARRLGVTVDYLNKCLSGKKDFTIEMLKRIEGLEVYIIDDNYPKSKKICDYIFSNLDEIEYRFEEIYSFLHQRKRGNFK